MKKDILYSDGADEICYPLEHWEMWLEDEEIDELELEEMKEDKTNGIRWCTYYAEFLEGSGTCGRHCSDYFPQNGVKGKCKFKTFTLAGTGNKFILTKEGLNKVQKSKLPLFDKAGEKL